MAPVLGMVDLLRHRGPEDFGEWSESTGNYTVALFHTRLRILDLTTAGHQPMVRGRLIISFNGEIYNFHELRRELEEAGYGFSTASDTEVLLIAYQAWGVGCLSRLVGMFSFAIWDGESRELFLARDRLGKKPLFFCQREGAFSFASEIKAILAVLEKTPEVDEQALSDYLTYLYIPYPRTIFRGIMQVVPGGWMRVRCAGNGLEVESGCYWDAMQESRWRDGGIREDCIDELESKVRNLVGEAVDCRLVSDVPLGVLLSGGLDSSAITAMMARSSATAVKSFSVGFEGNAHYDEIPFAKMVAEQFGCEHQVLQAEPSCTRDLAKIVWHFDQPFGNPTAVLTYVLSALTKRSVTVALAGDGGDELFGGYPRYVGAYLSTLPRALPGFLSNGLLPWLGRAMSDDTSGKHQFRRLREFLEGAGIPLIEMYLRWIGYFSPEDKKRLYTPEFAKRVQGSDSGDFLRGLYRESEGLEPLNRLAYVDVKSFLCCNVLEYADRMSMAHALELRAPLTDYRLVEFALRLPYEFKFRYAESKWIFRRAMRQFLPEAVLRKQKLGFNPPVSGWLKGELAGVLKEFLSRETVKQRGLFEPAEIERIMREHANGKRDYSLHLWALLILEIWFRLYMDGMTVEAVQEQIDRAGVAAAA